MSLTHQLQLELALASDEIVDVLHVCYIKWQIYDRGSGCKKGELLSDPGTWC